MRVLDRVLAHIPDFLGSEWPIAFETGERWTTLFCVYSIDCRPGCVNMRGGCEKGAGFPVEKMLFNEGLISVVI